MPAVRPPDSRRCGKPVALVAPPAPRGGSYRSGRRRGWVLAACVAVLAFAGAAVWYAVGGPNRPSVDAAKPGLATTPHVASQSGLSSAATASPSASSASPQPSTASASRRSTVKPPGVVGPPVGGPWPESSNTGVPSGTKLTTFSGSCTVTKAGTVIDAKTVNCDLDIRAADVMIKRSKINGAVGLNTDLSGSNKWSYTLADSEVNAGLRQYPAVSYGNMTIVRSNIYGGATSVQCGENALTCDVQDSWLHGQRIPSAANWHLGGFLSNGGHNIRIRHNTIVCDAAGSSAGGCTGDLNLFGDFAVVSDVIAESNYLGANTGLSYCLYGGSATSKQYPRGDHIVITNNVFQRGTNRKCGEYGPVTSFDTNGTGNVWKDNTWDDGGTLPADD